MKKIIIFSIIGLAFIAVLVWFGKMNSKSPIQFETEKPFKTDIVRKTVATGKVTPLEEIEIKPQVSGIIDKIYLEEGVKVKKGDLIAQIRVVPNEQALASARGRVNKAQLDLDNAKIQYDRNKKLYDNGVISKGDFEVLELNYNQAQQDLINAKNDYKIIKEGSTGASGTANTMIRAEVDGSSAASSFGAGVASRAGGNDSVKTVPAPSFDVTEIAPSCSWMMP